MGTTADKLNKVLESKNSIKTSLQNKGQPITDATPLSEYSTYIDNLVDTADATAIDINILKGKTAYVNGKKITGSIETYGGIFIDNRSQQKLVDISNINSYEDKDGNITETKLTYEEVI